MDQAILIELTADIVAAHVGNNAVPTNDVAKVIAAVYGALSRVGKPAAAPAPEPIPAVSVRASIKPDVLTCLECGGKFKTLKRHLRSEHGYTPDAYRARWNLPVGYPMVAPDYTQLRAGLAVKIGLGRKGRAAPLSSARPASAAAAEPDVDIAPAPVADAAPAPVANSAPPRAKRGRPKSIKSDTAAVLETARPKDAAKQPAESKPAEQLASKPIRARAPKDKLVPAYEAVTQKKPAPPAKPRKARVAAAKSKPASVSTADSADAA